MEIGSEFWLQNIPEEDFFKEVPDWLSKYGDTILTSSGRGAISLFLQQVTPQHKSVLLPAYICDSVILPFIEQGYTCYLYEVDEKLSPIIENIEMYENIGVFFHMGYYGFQTNFNLLKVLRYFQKQSTIIIEDVTHTLFSQFNRYEENDFYVGSIRKWFGVPSGGFLASSKRIVKRPVSINYDFSMLRTTALTNKGKYMKTNDDSLKSLFLSQFSNAEILLNEDLNPYCIDSSSIILINSLDVDELISRRRENFKVLLEGLESISYLTSPFKYLANNECPLFYPVMVKNNRNYVRKKLIDEKIYCPIHWPVPAQIKVTDLSSTLEVYNTILSIPCDQRYGKVEMDRIISILRSI
ncbi:DegT/DnrJ/EryC1/StrS family aminotransferase [Cytobacillus oceanisediminis]|uniref:DegT/DnrJ/EryC1/StrS family aminotransferase n=1 Tax=Cytobacillus oceanisediminis TaxID=665099 RepID=UPI0011A8C730|nr:DegT/DnrJ/EryC1/StrS family aminotransferase [Cytobacillus oceanisediminis]